MPIKAAMAAASTRAGVSIHPTSVVADGARLAAGVSVGPFCTIGPDVTVGAGTTLVSHVVLDGLTTIGGGCTIYPFATVGLAPQDLNIAVARPAPKSATAR